MDGNKSIKETNTEYSKLKKKKFNLEENEDALKKQNKLIKRLVQSSAKYMNSLRNIKNSENDILGSDYANEIASINDEMDANYKVIASLINDMNQENNNALKINNEQQEQVMKRLNSIEKRRS